LRLRKQHPSSGLRIDIGPVHLYADSQRPLAAPRHGCYDATYMMKEPSMKPQLYPAQRRHLERYAQGGGGGEGFKNTRSEQKLLELGFIERCDEIVRYTDTVTWTIYKARITPMGQAYLASG
jgi:hypothetical protein